MRHAATEPGLGDPPGFRLGDCATQRNLSDAGRADAQRIGERLRRERVPIARVYTSPWCRCRETAMLAFGSAQDWEPLSSVFDFPHREADFTERVKKRIGGYSTRTPGGNVAMVTHNVNIRARQARSRRAKRRRAARRLLRPAARRATEDQESSSPERAAARDRAAFSSWAALKRGTGWAFISAASAARRERLSSVSS